MTGGESVGLLQSTVCFLIDTIRLLQEKPCLIGLTCVSTFFDEKRFEFSDRILASLEDRSARSSRSSSYILNEIVGSYGLAAIVVY